MQQITLRFLPLFALLMASAPAFAQAPQEGVLPALPGATAVVMPPMVSPPVAPSLPPAAVVSPTPNPAVPLAPAGAAGALPALALPAAATPPTVGTPPAAPNAALPAVPPPLANTAPTPNVTANDDHGADVYSYGRSDVSVLFLPIQVDQMKDAIRGYESLKAQGKAAAPTFVGISLPTAAPEVIVEPKPYPVFYLSSIAYRAPGDWSLWVSGHKITAQKNPTDVHVVRVSADSATFTWTPSYAAALRKRKLDKSFAVTDALKNKLSTAQQIGMDEATGMVTFTLHANQSFAVAYFSTFEGFVESPELPPLVATASTAINITSTPAANAVPVSVGVPATAEKPPLVPDVALPSTPTFTMSRPPGRD